MTLLEDSNFPEIEMHVRQNSHFKYSSDCSRQLKMSLSQHSVGFIALKYETYSGLKSEINEKVPSSFTVSSKTSKKMTHLLSDSLPQ